MYIVKLDLTAFAQFLKKTFISNTFKSILRGPGQDKQKCILCVRKLVFCELKLAFCVQKLALGVHNLVFCAKN